MDGCSFFVFVFAFGLDEFGGDGGWVIVRKDASIAQLIGERFGSSNKVVEVLEFCSSSINAERNAEAARFLCLWRWDQWLDRIALSDGVR